jgi:hypothetical protein
MPESCAALFHSLPLLQPQIGGGTSEQQMHCEIKGKGSYLLINKELYLLQLAECHQKVWPKLTT